MSGYLMAGMSVTDIDINKRRINASHATQPSELQMTRALLYLAINQLAALALIAIPQSAFHWFLMAPHFWWHAATTDCNFCSIASYAVRQTHVLLKKEL